jgi:hypothetical protein
MAGPFLARLFQAILARLVTTAVLHTNAKTFVTPHKNQTTIPAFTPIDFAGETETFVFVATIARFPRILVVPITFNIKTISIASRHALN